MWRGYSDAVIDHAQNPRNLGSIENADGVARIKGACGDTMEIRLKVTDGTITEIAFWTDGCGSSIAAGSIVTELAKGKAVSEALKITALDVLNALGGLPDESAHCASLAASTLNAAVKSYIASRCTP